MTTCLQAQAIKVEDILLDFDEYTIVQMFPCIPDGHNETRDCLVIEKDGKQFGAIHDADTRECLEIRKDGRITIWQKGWWFV